MAATGLYRIKPRFVAHLRPLEDHLVRHNVSADRLTGLGFILAVTTAAAFLAAPAYPWTFALVPLACCIRMMANALDGSIARRTGTVGRRGAAANELADHVGDTVMIISGLAVAPAAPVVSAMLLSLLADDIASIDWAVHGRRRPSGPMSKPDRSLILGVAAPLAMMWPPALPMAFWLIALGSAFTVTARARLALGPEEPE